MARSILEFWVGPHILVLCGIASFVNTGFTQEQNTTHSLPDEHSAAPKAWKTLSSSDGIEVLDMIADQTQGNYEKLRTWKGTYAVRQQEYLPRETVAAVFRRELTEDSVSALWRTSDYTFRFAIDMASGSIYRSKETREVKWTRVESNEVVKIPNISPVDERSAVTSEDYLHFDPKAKWPRFGAVQDHPRAQNKRAAFRDPREKAQKQEHGDLMDPRSFFGFGVKFWDEARLLARGMKGDLGEDQKRKASELVTLYKAVGASGTTWYRMDEDLSGPPGSTQSSHIYLTYIRNSAAGFNPVSLSMMKDKAGKQPVRSMKWSWKQFGGCYIPLKVQESNYSRETGNLSFGRAVEVQECSVNEPIEASQFGYKGLGMKDGDLVMDNIAKACYVIENGALDKIANLGEKYSPPGASGAALSKGWGVALNASILVVLVAIFIVRRYQKRLA